MLGVDGVRLHGPARTAVLVPRRETGEVPQAHPAVAEAMAQFPRITKATVAIGSWDAEGSQLYASLTLSEAKQLRTVPVAAEVCAMLLDDAGRPIRTGLDGRTVSIGYEQLRDIPEVIAVAAGASKARAIHAVVRSGIATSLVTDSEAAKILLNQ